MKQKNILHLLMGVMVGFAAMYKFPVLGELVSLLDLPVWNSSGRLLTEVFFGIYTSVGIFLFLLCNWKLKILSYPILGGCVGIALYYPFLKNILAGSLKEPPVGMFIFPLLLLALLALVAAGIEKKEKVES